MCVVVLASMTNRSKCRLRPPHTFNGIRSVNSVVWKLRISLGDVSNVRLVVSQNQRDNETYTEDLRSLLNREQHQGVFCILEHVLTPMLSNERNSPFGSKRNAQNNLLQGLRAVFRREDESQRAQDTPRRRLRLNDTTSDADKVLAYPRHVVILEDDVELSPDAMDYFACVRASCACIALCPTPHTSYLHLFYREYNGHGQSSRRFCHGALDLPPQHHPRGRRRRPRESLPILGAPLVEPAHSRSSLRRTPSFRLAPPPPVYLCEIFNSVTQADTTLSPFQVAHGSTTGGHRQD